MSMSKVATLGAMAALASDPQYVAAKQQQHALEKLAVTRVGGKMVSPRKFRAEQQANAKAKRQANYEKKMQQAGAEGQRPGGELTLSGLTLDPAPRGFGQHARRFAQRNPIATALGLGGVGTAGGVGLSHLLGGGGSPAVLPTVTPTATTPPPATAGGSDYLPYLLAALGVGTAGVGAGMYYGSGDGDEKDE